jgi:hypothetical protein
LPDEGGRRAVVVAGDQLSLLRVRPGAEPEQVILATDAASLRGLHALDLDADGAPEVVGYMHPDLLGFRTRAGPHEPLTLASLVGQTSVLSARMLALGGGGAPELVVLTVASEAVAVSVTADVVAGSRVSLPSVTVETPDAPLLQRIPLR